MIAPHNLSSSALLLARLDGVQKTGKGWRAMCPACGGKSRKLSVCQCENGTLLVTCFSCHDTPAVMRNLGLELADLFPERIKDPSPEARREAREAFKRSAWVSALGVLGREAGVVLIAARDLLSGRTLPADDMERLALAEDRIARAREVLA